MSEELVSIVVPVYNMGMSIENCVGSLIRQSYQNIEVILVDDGSKDDSLAKCYALQKKDSRIRVFHTENRGSGPARNTGIDMATGRYIYFPDADDKVEENAISMLVDAMENGKYDLVVFGYKSIDSNGKCALLKQFPEMGKKGEDIRNSYSDHVAATRTYAIQGAPWNKFFDLDVVKKYKVEYPPLRRHQDEGFICRYMCHCGNVHFISAVLYIHYLNDLKKEWDKYPINYIDAVMGLYQIKKSTILSWNQYDARTKEIVDHEYICNTIKAMELSYSPKMKMNSTDRMLWVEEQIRRAGITDITVPTTLGYYQRLVLALLKKGNVRTAMLIMRVKVEAEKRGALGFFRRKK